MERRRGRKLRDHRGMWLPKLGESSLLENSLFQAKTKLTVWVSASFSLSCASLRRWQSTTLVLSAPLPHFTGPRVWAQTLDLKLPPLQLTCSSRASHDKISFLCPTAVKENKLHTENYVKRIFKAHTLKGQVKDTQFSRCQNGSGAKLGEERWSLVAALV